MVAIKTVKIKNLMIGPLQRTRVMGIINLSPESFYKGSITETNETLPQVVSQMEENGASLIDVGAASTAPHQIYGTRHIELEEELVRIQNTIETITDHSSLPVSIDTTSSIVAREALDQGASLINDVSGLHMDEEMASLAAESDVPIILVADYRRSYTDIEEIIGSLRESIQIAMEAGVREDRIILDPGVGFGKPSELDCSIIRNVRSVLLIGYPVLLGVSRKSFIGEILEQPDPEERLYGSVAATSLAVAHGAAIIRTHDVKATLEACRIGENLMNRRIIHQSENILIEGMDELEGTVLLERVGTGAEIRSALSRKAVLLNVALFGVRSPAALIIKQEMLAVGGDAAYHFDVIDGGIERTDLLVIGTEMQLRRVAAKLSKMHYFGLPEISDSIYRLLEDRWGSVRV